MSLYQQLKYSAGQLQKLAREREAFCAVHFGSKAGKKTHGKAELKLNYMN
jgi:hypothetical protein